MNRSEGLSSGRLFYMLRPQINPDDVKKAALEHWWWNIVSSRVYWRATRLHVHTTWDSVDLSNLSDGVRQLIQSELPMSNTENIHTRDVILISENEAFLLRVELLSIIAFIEVNHTSSDLQDELKKKKLIKWGWVVFVFLNTRKIDIQSRSSNFCPEKLETVCVIESTLCRTIQW